MFSEWLPRCHELESLHLGANDFGDAGCIALAAAISANAVHSADSGRSLLGSGKNLLKLGGKKKTARACPALQLLSMHDNENLGSRGANALAASLRRGALPALKKVSFPTEAVTPALREVCATRGITLQLGRHSQTASAQAASAAKAQERLRENRAQLAYGVQKLPPLGDDNKRKRTASDASGSNGPSPPQSTRPASARPATASARPVAGRALAQAGVAARRPASARPGTTAPQRPGTAPQRPTGNSRAAGNRAKQPILLPPIDPALRKVREGYGTVGHYR